MNDKLRKLRAAPVQTARPPLQARLFRRERIVTAAVILLGLLCLILTLLVFRNPGNQRYTFAPQSFYMLQPESVTEESIPDYAGIRVSYSFTVPDGAKVRHGAKMCIFLEHCIAEIRLDGELHYSSAASEGPHVGRTPGRLWLSVPMRSDYSGKTVTVTLTPVYDAASLASPPYLFIEREQLMTRILLPEDLTALVIGIVTLIVGLFLTLFSALLLMFQLPFYEIFTTDKEVLAEVSILTFPIILNLYGGATRSGGFALINGTGRSKLNLFVAIFDGMISRIGIAALLYFSFNMGALGCWYGDALAGFMPIVIGGIFFLSGKWKTPVSGRKTEPTAAEEPAKKNDQQLT